MFPTLINLSYFSTQIQLRRDILERWVNEPDFEKDVVGCYVCICVGSIEDQNVYRMAEIKGIYKGFDQYTMTNKVKNIPFYINLHIFSHSLKNTLSHTF